MKTYRTLLAMAIFAISLSSNAHAGEHWNMLKRGVQAYVIAPFQQGYNNPAPVPAQEVVHHQPAQQPPTELTEDCKSGQYWKTITAYTEPYMKQKQPALHNALQAAWRAVCIPEMADLEVFHENLSFISKTAQAEFQKTNSDIAYQAAGAAESLRITGH